MNLTSIRKLRKTDLLQRLEDAGVTIPEGRVLKERLVELYSDYLHNQAAASEYSSEEDEGEPTVTPQQQQEHVLKEDKIDLSLLADKELTEMLVARGVNVGPIMASTRELYVNRLRKLIDQQQNENKEELFGDAEFSDTDAPIGDSPIVHVTKVAETNGLHHSSGDSFAAKKTTTTFSQSCQFSKVIVDSSVVENNDDIPVQEAEKTKVTMETVLTQRKPVHNENVVVTTKKVTKAKSSFSFLRFVFKLFMAVVTLGLFGLFIICVHVMMEERGQKLITFL